MNVKNLVFGIGIVVVFALTLWQGIETFYASPEWDEYCGRIYSEPFTKTFNASCPSFENNPAVQSCYSEKGQPIYEYDESGCVVGLKECNFCQLEFDEAQDRHAKFAFYISILVGILAVIVGYTILKVEPVGSALIGSGIWSFFYGTVVNWRNFTNIWRFLLLFVALVLIIWLAVRLNEKRK